MKKPLLLLLLCCQSAFLTAQQTDISFYFNVLSPDYAYGVYAPDDLGFALGWSVPVTEPVQGELVIAPLDAETDTPIFCTASDESNAGKLVLVERGTCTFAQKVWQAQQTGAIGVVIMNNFAGQGVFQMAFGQDSPDSDIPVAMVSFELGTQLQNILAAGDEIIAEFSPEAAPYSGFNGYVSRDENNDCLYNADEIRLGGRQVTATNGAVTHTAFTDEEGYYEMRFGLGTYTVDVIPNSDIWTTCGDGQTFTFTEFASETADFAVEPLADCAQVSVEISTPFWRRCFPNTVTIAYCNEGTIPAEDAYVELTLPDLVSILTASLPYTVNDLGQYIFPVGDDTGALGVGQCGTITLLTETSCDAVLNQVLCAKAVGYPDIPCVLPTSDWTGASVTAEGNCGDQIVLALSNNGTGDMSAPADYRILRDGEIYDTGTFQLTAGASETFGYPIDGAWYRIEADAEVTQPFVTAPSYTVFDCPVTDEPQTAALDFTLADYGTSHDLWCGPVIGAYDPNDKNANPRGYGDAHFIEQNTDIEYLIRFQNTGNDTAFRVVILDTLSEHFDVGSLRLKAKSHDYDLSILEGNILQFTFEKINLVDSFTNEPASHGYFNFVLSQNEDVPLGTVIENSAAIYFDFNEPVITNTFFHTVGKDFLPTTAVDNPTFEPLEITFAPHPLTEETRVSVAAENIGSGLLELTDAHGSVVLTQDFTENEFVFSAKGLASGLYFYRVFLEGKFLGSGKVVRF